MTTVKLSQWEMMLLEAARAHGYGDEEIIHKLGAGDSAPFQDVEGGKYDFAPLFELYSNAQETLEKAIRSGYEIKFTTFNGIKFFLNKRYDIQADRDYEVKENYLDGVRLSDEQLASLRSTVSKNWRFVELERAAEPGESVIRIELAV